MEEFEAVRLLCILIIIACIPAIIYFIYVLSKKNARKKRIRASNARKKRIRASWEEIKKHISLDEMEEKTKKWKKEGYDVSELEEMLEEVK